RGLVRVATPQGASVFRASLSTGQRRGEVFVPIHWTDRQSSGGRAGLLPRPLVDPHSGQPGFKATPARIEPLAAQWHGFLITREPRARLPALDATRVRVARGWLVELADDGDPATFAKAVLPKGERVEILDRGRGETRIAIVREGRLEAVLYASRGGRLPEREWLIGQLCATAEPSPTELLAGRPAKAMPDRGPIVCACFDVGLATIVAVIRQQRLVSVEAVGEA